MARVVATASLLSLIVFCMAPLFSAPDSILFKDVMHGFGELLPSVHMPVSSQPAAGAELATAAGLISSGGFFHYLALLIFSSLSVWAAYKFVGSARIVVAVQLFVLSLVYQLAIWQCCKIAGHPTSLLVGIIAGSLVGRLLKSRDDEKRQFDAKQVELKLRNEELQESRLAMVKQDESERRLLAADLHDQVLNDLRTIQKKFRAFADAPDPETRDKIDALMKQTMTDIREIMDELCPVMLEEFGLAAAIEDRLDKASQLAGFDVRFNQTGNGNHLDELLPVQRLLLYRLVQESLTNICKHANASLVRVVIQDEESQLVISVTDNGKGIDPSLLSESSRGTLYMRLRAALIGAKVSWKQGPDGKGTTVEIRVHVQDSGG